MSTLVMMQQDMGNYDYRYRHKEVMLSSGTSQPILIFNTMHDVNCAIYPDPGTSAYYEYTISSASDVTNDVAVWFQWPLGGVGVKAVDAMISNATAVRLQTDGPATFEVSGV